MIGRRQLLVAAICFALYLALGLAVGHHSPSGFDRAIAAATFGAATPLAAALTAAGRLPAYLTVSIVVLVAGAIRRTLLGDSVTAVVLLCVAWTTSDAFKLAFERVRPDRWLVTRESSWSYASGHATLSLAFYGFWALVALRSQAPRPARIAVASALVLLIAAIGWSRLALGAHYATDVIGGYLLGAALLSIAFFMLVRRDYYHESRREVEALAAEARRRRP